MHRYNVIYKAVTIKNSIIKFQSKSLDFLVHIFIVTACEPLNSNYENLS